MRLHRFYIHKPLGEELVVESAGEKESESKLLHQWTHVFRYQSGDEVFLFSASTPGRDFLYRIAHIAKQSVTLVPVSSVSNIIPARTVTLVMALVKKDTFETIVRQATELGVSRIIPLMAERSEKKNLNFERLSLISIEASEQSGRGDIPAIAPIATFEEAHALTSDAFRITGSLHGKALYELPFKETGKETSIWIGPEGGWTADEEKRMEALQFSLLKMTDTVLKADTAATSALALFASAYPPAS